MAAKQGIVPVWFFVGVILFIYGILILITGIAEFHHPPETVQLSQYHAPLWWGMVLTVFGGLYVFLFRPKKPKDVQA